MESNGLPVSIVCSPANEHDSTGFIDAMENISELACDELIQQIATVYAGKGYDAGIHWTLSEEQWNRMLLHSIQEKFQIHCAGEPTKCLQQDKVCCRGDSLPGPDVGSEELQ